MTLKGVSRVTPFIKVSNLIYSFRNMASFPQNCIKIDMYRSATIDLTSILEDDVPKDTESFKQALECEFNDFQHQRFID